MLKQLLRFIASLELILLVGATLKAGSLIPPRHLGELSSLSDATVLARASASRAVKHGSLLFTRTSFEVLDVVRGSVRKGDSVCVETPGGVGDGVAWLVLGSPRFLEGQVYLLFLNRKSPDVWQPRMLSYGLLQRVRGRDGTNLLVPLAERDGLQPFPRPDGVVPDPVGIYREKMLLSHLTQVVRGEIRWNSKAVLAPSEVVPLQAMQALAPPSQCAFMSYGGLNIRWNVFDGGGQVTVSANATGDNSIPGGGFAEVQGAVSDWMSVPNTTINLSYGGAMSYAMTCTGNQDTPASGVNIVMFNDPCSDIPDLSGCTGTLAFGGPWFGGTHTFDGATWYSIQSCFVVVNNGVGCLGSANYRRMIAHELAMGWGLVT